MSEIPDPYASVLVHGLSPLVRDGEGLRFAVAGEDHPTACVMAPEDLPDCETSLHLFPDDAVMAGWVDAATRFGGNAVSVRTRPGGHRMPAMALVMRLDRPRHAGSDVDACVTLEVWPGMDADTVRDSLAAGRRKVEAERRTSSAKALWEREWAPEIAALAEAGLRVSYRAALESAPGRPLLVEIPDGRFVTGRTYEVTRSPDGLVVRIPVNELLPFHTRATIGPELQPERQALLDRLGLRDDGEHLLKTVPSLQPGIVEALRRDEAEVRETFAALQERQRAISRVEAVRADERKMAFLRRVNDGHLVVRKGMGTPACWMTVTGKTATVPGVLVGECMNEGLLGYAWSVTTDFDPDFPHAPDVLTLTRTAKAIVAGDIHAARETIGADREARGGRSQRRDFRAAMAAALGHLDAGALSALGELAAREGIPPVRSDRLEHWARTAVIAGTTAAPEPAPARAP